MNNNKTLQVPMSGRRHFVKEVVQNGPHKAEKGPTEEKKAPHMVKNAPLHKEIAPYML